MKNKLIAFVGLVVGFSPLAALAQVGTTSGSTVCNTTVSNLGDVICRVGSLLNKVIPVLIVLGVVFFVWGVISYVISSDEEAKKAGKNRMIWGIIGLVIIVGMWGLVTIVTNTFGIDNNANIVLPTVPTYVP